MLAVDSNHHPSVIERVTGITTGRDHIALVLIVLIIA
jgi:hypothetical protein